MRLIAVDDVWIRVECDEHVARELYDHFSYDLPAAKFMQAYRKRQWNGKIHLFKLRGHLIYRGLLPRVIDFANQCGYTVVNDVPVPLPQTPDNLDQFITDLGLPNTPRDYQVAGMRTILDDHRGVIISPTGSGKSLIIYPVTQCLNLPTLIVVPTIGLVEQMRKDLIDYGADPDTIQTISGGFSKAITHQFTISTWQSIYELPQVYYNQFRCVVVDEVHLAKAKSLMGLMEKCKHVPFRMGCSGTLDGCDVHQLVLEGLFGRVTRVTTTHALQQRNELSSLSVKLCAVKYPVDVCKELRRVPYSEEVEFLISHAGRLELVAQLAAKSKGVTLVLFNYVEKHGEPLFRRIQDIVVDRPVHFIAGKVSGESREAIRQLVLQGDRDIIVASYGTFSTGINIPNLQTLIFASPSKSKIRVLQSIGRVLRLHSNKVKATLIDVIDDLRVGSSVNHTFRHAEQRVQYYAAERFPYELVTCDLETWVRRLTANGSKTG